MRGYVINVRSPDYVSVNVEKKKKNPFLSWIHLTLRSYFVGLSVSPISTVFKQFIKVICVCRLSFFFNSNHLPHV